MAIILNGIRPETVKHGIQPETVKPIEIEAKSLLGFIGYLVLFSPLLVAAIFNGTLNIVRRN